MQRGFTQALLPLENSLVTAHGCILCAVKQAEEGDALVLRVYNAKSEPSNSRLEFCRNVSSAQRLAIPEWPTMKFVKLWASAVSSGAKAARYCNCMCSLLIQHAALGLEAGTV